MISFVIMLLLEHDVIQACNIFENIKHHDKQLVPKLL